MKNNINDSSPIEDRINYKILQDYSKSGHDLVALGNEIKKCMNIRDIDTIKNSKLFSAYMLHFLGAVMCYKGDVDSLFDYLRNATLIIDSEDNMEIFLYYLKKTIPLKNNKIGETARIIHHASEDGFKNLVGFYELLLELNNDANGYFEKQLLYLEKKINILRNSDENPEDIETKVKNLLKEKSAEAGGIKELYVFFDMYFEENKISITKEKTSHLAKRIFSKAKEAGIKSNKGKPYAYSTIRKELTGLKPKK